MREGLGVTLLIRSGAHMVTCTPEERPATETPLEGLAARDGSHHLNSKGYGKAELDKFTYGSKRSEGANAVRGREQWLIDRFGGARSMGGTSGNAINGISPSNPNRQKYEDARKKLFGGE